MWYNDNMNEEELSDYEKKIIPMIALLTATNMKDVNKCLTHINTSSKIKKIIRKGIKNMDENNYKFGIPYDPVEDWRKIFRGALKIRQEELREEFEEKLEEKLEDSKQEKLDMIDSLYNQGISLNVIAKASNLSVAEVEKIVNQSKSKKH